MLSEFLMDIHGLGGREVLLIFADYLEERGEDRLAKLARSRKVRNVGNRGRHSVGSGIFYYLVDDSNGKSASGQGHAYGYANFFYGQGYGLNYGLSYCGQGYGEWLWDNENVIT